MAKQQFHRTAGRRVLWLVLAHLAGIVLITGCQSEDVANTASASLTPAITVEKTESQLQTSAPEESISTAPIAPAPPESRQGPEASTTATAADPQAVSRQLQQAEEASAPYQVIGQHTRNFMDLYDFFEAAGWNQAIDSMTMKSCPTGYEVFCEARGVFVQLFQDAGGDVEALTQLVQQTDFRTYLYQLAAAADMYQNQYQNLPPQAGIPSPDVSDTPPEAAVKQGSNN